MNLYILLGSLEKEQAKKSKLEMHLFMQDPSALLISVSQSCSLQKNRLSEHVPFLIRARKLRLGNSKHLYP